MDGLCAVVNFDILRITPTLLLAVIQCHISSLMGRDKLNIADVSRLSGLNRSTITALYRETATRIELPAIEQLCRLFNCSVGELLELVPDNKRGAV